MLKKRLNLLIFLKLDKYKLDNKSINLINVNFNQSKAYEKISNRSNDYISQSFNIALKIMRKKYQINLSMAQFQKIFFKK